MLGQQKTTPALHNANHIGVTCSTPARHKSSMEPSCTSLCHSSRECATRLSFTSRRCATTVPSRLGPANGFRPRRLRFSSTSLMLELVCPTRRGSGASCFALGFWPLRKQAADVHQYWAADYPDATWVQMNQESSSWRQHRIETDWRTSCMKSHRRHKQSLARISQASLGGKRCCLLEGEYYSTKIVQIQLGSVWRSLAEHGFHTFRTWPLRIKLVNPYLNCYAIMGGSQATHQYDT